MMKSRGGLKGNRVLVTGATGFVGANLARRLVAEAAEVIVLVRPGSDRWRLQSLPQPVRFEEGDLEDPDGIRQAVLKARPAVIFHCAFPGGHGSDEETVRRMLAAGVMGTYGLLSAAREAGVGKFIHIGSSTEYGFGPGAHRESDRLDPVSIRGVSKAASSLLCRQFGREHDLPVAILRLFTVYGPWESPGHLLPQACRALLDGKPLEITPPGFVHDWIFVDDVVEACLAAAACEYPTGEVFNIGSGEQHTNEEVVETLAGIAGRKLELKVGRFSPRAIDSKSWLADVSNAREKLGWQPGHTLQAGLKETYEFWQGRHEKHN
ncbi:MAG TPA: NAD(P)-dependent oxidoreductase [Anaerolineales bacterium]|nr:NAD(P)-dependent oxidoreductase [Anaerolineales bacterium]